MPRTDPLPDWTGADAYLIGGGRSLRGFDFESIGDCNVIGCNQAFELGAHLVDICIFGDFKFYVKKIKELERYDGWVVTPRHTMTKQADWVRIFERQDEGLSTTKIAWNANTGAAAINLALILGAERVYLLGYDCCMDADGVKDDPGTSHWHNSRIETPTPEHYGRFLAGFWSIARALPSVFPGRQVINVTNGESKLDCFPVASFKDVGL